MPSPTTQGSRFGNAGMVTGDGDSCSHSGFLSLNIFYGWTATRFHQGDPSSSNSLASVSGSLFLGSDPDSYFSSLSSEASHEGSCPFLSLWDPKLQRDRVLRICSTFSPGCRTFNKPSSICPPPSTSPQGWHLEVWETLVAPT